MTCGTPDQVVASILNQPLWNADVNCETLMHYYWSDLTAWPFSISIYLPYFLATLALELLALSIFLKIRKQKITSRWMITCLFVNLASHPLAFYVTPWISNEYRIRWDYCLVGAELLVLVLEAWIYRLRMQLSVKQALLYSWLINLVSWWIGSFILS